MRFKINPKYYGLEKFLKGLPGQFDQFGETIYEGRNTIKYFEENGLRINVKSFKIPHFINKVAYAYIRGSKARHSYEYAMEMIRRGANTPEPIAYLEVLRNGLFARSYYVSLHHEYDFTIRDIIGYDYPDKENVLKQFAVFTYEKLHLNGIHHLDYSRGNILIQKGEANKYFFSVVDINRMKFERMNYLKGLKNFAQLWANEKELEVVAREYARINGEDEHKAIKLLIQFDQAHKLKIDRKNALKRKLRNKTQV
ncbi:hypothetical protein [Ancylomarina longa]|uniref:Lipopolysaccharide kinase (Kdo/WaaP) family protein n=1 Tax=Ancylomarina longa TaxID=2487017 RepID=A0A434AZX0_9BACT|nr:hypothetical protein [Ancylomarina longa]RUT80096.1 hypothetical protein DLK05_01685 [Ancylomarina longa]